MTVCKFADFFPEVWLVSTDSDWDLILQDNVQRFSFVTRKIYSSSSILADKGLTIDQLVSLKVLKGDAKDNITGIEGVGDKRAAALIDEYGSALDILDAIPLQGDNKYIQNVNNSAHIIERNYKLIDLVSFHEENIGEHMNSVSKDLEVYLNVDN
jgi:DNA polymerase-1